MTVGGSHAINASLKTANSFTLCNELDNLKKLPYSPELQARGLSSAHAKLFV